MADMVLYLIDVEVFMVCYGVLVLSARSSDGRSFSVNGAVFIDAAWCFIEAVRSPCDGERTVRYAVSPGACLVRVSLRQDR